LDSRSRFLEIVSFNTSVRTLDWEFGYWRGTVDRWYSEGLNEKHGLAEECGVADPIAGPGITWPLAGFPKDADIEEQLDLDPGFEKVDINAFFLPPFEREILREEEDRLLVRDELGVKKYVKRDGSTLPEIVSGPVEDEEGWEALKDERLQADFSARKPANWDRLVERYRHRSFPLSLSGPITGFFGVLRFLFGEPQVYYLFHDNPTLIHAVNSHLCEFWIDLFSEVLLEVDVDCVHFWEDMSGKQGSLISEHCFREFMSPYYKRLTGSLRKRGIEHFFVDTDGYATELIPLFNECGVNGMYPFEVQAGCDIVEIRKRFPDLLMMGGLDKRVLAQSRDDIDRELRGKLPFMLEHGGYIPYADHVIPPDASWENFAYYRESIKAMIGKG